MVVVMVDRILAKMEAVGNVLVNIETVRIILSVALVSVAHCSAPVEMSHEKRLIKDLINDYKDRGIMGRPVRDQNDTITIHYGLSLIQILDLDEKNQILTTNVWATYNWNDMYLRWDKDKYGNITTVRVRNEDIWKPDIKLYNYADTRMSELRDANCVLSNDGSVVWIPQAVFKSSCSIDIRDFPFDVQTCHLKFGSWTYDGSKLDLQFLYLPPGFEMTDYITSNEWDIIQSDAKRNVKIYPCCPEPYVDLVFNLQIRRKAAFYNTILILPCVLLSLLTLVLFWLPPESPAKMQLGMNIFVAFFVLLLLLAESTPPASSSIPLIGVYYCLSMILITLSTLLAAIVVNLYFHGADTTVPKIIKKIMLEGFARIFCMPTAQLLGNAEKTPTSPSSRPLYTPTNQEKRYDDIKNDRVGHLEMHSDNALVQSVLHHSSQSPSGEPEASTDTMQGTLGNNGWQFAKLEFQVREIHKYLKLMADTTAKKEAREKRAKEWKLVSLVLDRLFFFLYLIVFVVSACTVFQTTFLQEGATDSKQ